MDRVSPTLFRGLNDTRFSLSFERLPRFYRTVLEILAT
jgi:hypothetical protein